MVSGVINGQETGGVHQDEVVLTVVQCLFMQLYRKNLHMEAARQLPTIKAKFSVSLLNINYVTVGQSNQSLCLFS